MTLEDFNKVKHDLRNSVNHILGYSRLIQEDAADFNDDRTAFRAKNIESCGRLLASRIDELPSAEIDVPNPDRMKALRLAFLPLIDQILEAASFGDESCGGCAYADDLQRICKAANQLMALVTA